MHAAILTLALPLALAAALPARAQAPPSVLSGAPSAASVTIYRDRELKTADLGELDRAQGLAMITETRTVDVPAGVSRIVFRGVADTLVPETVAVQGLPGRLIERNEDFNLLSPGSLVARSIGQTVQVVRTDKATGKVTARPAILRSGPDGVVLDTGGRVQALGCGGLPERLVFDRVPEGLGDKATFSVLAEVPKAGRYTVKFSYLATGFTWSADYVAHIRPDGRTLDLTGWLTLANKSSAGFADAPTQVVAGDLERDPATQPPPVEALSIAAACWGQALPPPAARTMRVMAPAVEHRMAEPSMLDEIVVTGSKVMAKQGELGDYKLYTLPEPTTVAARQTKQVAFLDQAAVPFERVYVARHRAYENQAPDAGDPQAPTIVLRLRNKADAGLGKPLPAGIVSALQPGAGGPVLAGQAEIAGTPVGLPIELKVGQAMDLLVATRVVTDDSASGRQDRAYEVSIANAKAQPVTFEYRETPVGQDFQIRRASQRFATDRGDKVWTIRLAPGERATFSFEVSYRD